MAEVILKNVRKVYPNTESKKKKKKDEAVEKKNNLEITDEGVVAVQDFNIDVADKEFIVLVGPSGCGKSTTLRMIAGLEEISGGELFIDGKQMNDVAPKDRDIAMVFQNYALYPHMTVYENIAFPLKLKKIAETDADGKTHLKKMPNDEIDRRVREAAEVLDITQFLDRKPKALSGGQRQRVAIGRAIVRSPKVLLMDEPLSNLDAKLRNQMRAEIIKLREKIDTTFIYVTHDQVEAMTLGDRIVIMRDGYIQQIGTPQEVFNHPANLFVAGFIGSPQMNFFENCQLTKTADSYTLTVMGETVTLTAEQSAKLAAAGVESRSVTAGVRPVHIALGESGIPAEVDVSELMGSELHLHLAANGQDVVAVIPTANIDPMAYARHTALLVFIGRYFTRAPRLTVVFSLLKTTVLHPNFGELPHKILTLGLTAGDLLIVAAGILIVHIVEFFEERGTDVRGWLNARKSSVQVLILLVSLLILAFFGIFRSGYISSEFIYGQF